MERCKEIGATAMSITDHGTNAGHREFLREAKAAGIKPILGQEAYITLDRFDRRSKAKRTDGTSVYNHITLLAQDQRGLENLNHYSNTAWNEGFYNKPRGDIDLLEDCNEGLIVLSGCMSGMIPKAIEAGDIDEAYRLATRFKDILGDRFYIEVMATNSSELNHQLLDIADKLGTQPVMTSDCHYAKKEDLWVEEAMLILSTNPKPDFKADFSRSQKMDILDRYNYLYPGRTMTFQEIEVYMRDHATEKELFVAQGIERDDIFENTHVIADRIGEYEYYEGLDLLPKPKGQDPAVLLRKKVYAGLKKMGKDADPKYTERAERELKVIRDKGFDSYFLVVGNTVRWAKGQGIRMSAGRGSGAGSLVNRALGITELDPIEHNLLFERFLDPSRPDWPDVDLDFQDTRRGEVKDYLKRQFKHVASIMTVTKLQGKSAIRDAARVFRVPLADVNRALKDLDAPGEEDALDFFAEAEQCKEFFRKYPEVMDLARRLEGRIKSVAMHPGGVVVSKEPIDKYAPMETAKDPNDKEGPRIPMVAIDMHEAESLGLIKIDLLGLKTLSVIDDAIEYIRQRHGKDIDINAIPMDDAGVYAEMSQGHTAGVFQMEKSASTRLILAMGGIHSLDELSVVNALVRPGAMKTMGSEYIARKKGQHMVEYVHPKMIPYTKDTFGLPTLYQEQVMQMCVELGGMTLTEANQLRRGLGKKKIEYILPFKEKFISNATEAVGPRKAEKLWSDVEAGAGYGFNKSHSVAYSILGYQCAWLKYHYPVEFMAAVLRNEKDKDAVTDYLIECKRMGIKVLLPHVNKSGLMVEPEGDNGVRLGLTSIKFIAQKAANNLLAARPFETYADLEAKAAVKGSGITSRMLGALNAVGAARFKDNPLNGRERDNFYEYLKIPAFGHIDLEPVVKYKFRPLDEYSEKGVFPVLGMVRGIKRGEGWARVEIVNEEGSVGIFADKDTPIEAGEMYALLVADNRIARYVTVEDLYNKVDSEFVNYLYDLAPVPAEDGQYRTIAYRKYKTKKGSDMAYLVAMDHLGNLLHILAFPRQYPQARIVCRPGKTWSAVVTETEDGTLNIKDFT